MTNLVNVLFVFLLVVPVHPSAENQLFRLPEAAIIGNLDRSIISDIITILVEGTVELVGNCSYSNDASLVQFWLYTRENPEDAIILKSIDHLNFSKPIKILIHGWGGNADIDYIHVIKEAYLERYDCNVISVDYSVYAENDFKTAYCYVPAIAATVARFMCTLDTKINISSLHVVGHSLGAQISGVAGHKIQKQCNATVGRITGLDPAGPLFLGRKKSSRLDSSDALFVDVIHTNQAQYGYLGNCGTIDFYPNCGYYQPGCIAKLFESFNQGSILDMALSVVTCSHQRSCYLFAESIIDNSFYSTSCFGCTTPLCGPVSMFFYGNPTFTYMGESCRSRPRSRKREFVCYTHLRPPYALGPTGPLN